MKEANELTVGDLFIYDKPNPLNFECFNISLKSDLPIVISVTQVTQDQLFIFR
jgi:hypothetical protein